MSYYQVISGLDLGADLQRRFELLIWQQLTVTTEVNRLGVFRRMISTGDNWLAYLAYYGWMLERIATVKNLRIDADLKQQVVDLVRKHFHCRESPVVSLQVMFGGQMLPLHIDTPKHASLVFPIGNHAAARTNFYRALRPVDSALPNPRQCECVESIVISQPTLIDTDCIHSVVYDVSITKRYPRISLTAKWSATNFQDLTGLA